MKTVFIYSSDKGYVSAWGEKLAKKYGEGFTALDIKKGIPPAEIENFDTVILASSIHAGSAGKKIRNFCRLNIQLLEKKNIILVLAGLEEKEYGQYFENTFPMALLERAAGKLWIGGRFDPDQHNFFIRMIMKKIKGQSGGIFSEKWDTVDEALKLLDLMK
ncbi:MAG: hypothetical protein H7A26_06810 [Spirochaetales bacterium]|nr:hypothetical protein [Spirochaetales bacterium]